MFLLSLLLFSAEIEPFSLLSSSYSFVLNEHLLLDFQPLKVLKLDNSNEIKGEHNINNYYKTLKTKLNDADCILIASYL